MTVKASDIPTWQEFAIQQYKDGVLTAEICRAFQMEKHLLYKLLYLQGVPLRRPTKFPRKPYGPQSKRFNI